MQRLDISISNLSQNVIEIVLFFENVYFLVNGKKEVFLKEWFGWLVYWML